VGADLPVYAHVPNVLGTDGRKLSKRHGATGVDELRAQGYYAPALMNFLALLGWSFDDRTTIMSRDELIERFTLERVLPSAAAFDYEKLDWMNGVYLRALGREAYADVLVEYLRGQGCEWNELLVRRAAPLVQKKIERLGQFGDFVGFLFGPVEPASELLDGSRPVLEAASEALAGVEPFDAEHVEAALRGMADRLELKPRDAFQPVRIAITGSKVSAGLFESIELLGREETLERLSVAAVQIG
jgi:glutamyl-tRNA synthetase